MIGQCDMSVQITTSEYVVNILNSLYCSQICNPGLFLCVCVCVCVRVYVGWKGVQVVDNT